MVPRATHSGAITDHSHKPLFALREVDGNFCAHLTTDALIDGLTASDIAAVIDPLNWPLIHPFFRNVTLLDGASQNGGWTRILEEVSTDADQYVLRTTLKYCKGRVSGAYILNYDLDERRHPDDSGLVIVDRGYIWVSPEKTGCRIRTGKELLIAGMSAATCAQFASTEGWADLHTHLCNAARHTSSCRFVSWSELHDDRSSVPEIGATSVEVNDKLCAARSNIGGGAVGLPLDFRKMFIEQSVSAAYKVIPALLSLALPPTSQR